MVTSNYNYDTPENSFSGIPTLALSKSGSRSKVIPSSQPVLQAPVFLFIFYSIYHIFKKCKYFMIFCHIRNDETYTPCCMDSLCKPALASWRDICTWNFRPQEGVLSIRELYLSYTTPRFAIIFAICPLLSSGSLYILT